MYALTTITPPTTEPVSLALAKSHLAIDHDDLDDWISSAIKTARELTERYCGRRWITQTVRMKLPGWPDCLPESDPLYDADGLIRLPVEPVTSVSSVKYLDADGDEQTVAAGDLDTWLDHSPPIIGPADEWPDAGDFLGAVRVEFVAGGSCPEGVKTAILLCLGLWDEERGDQNTLIAKGIPPAARAILDSLWTGANC